MEDLRWLSNCELSRVEIRSNPNDRPIPASFFADLSSFKNITEILWLCDDGSGNLVKLLQRQEHLRTLMLGNIRLTDQDLSHPRIFCEMEALDLDLLDSPDVNGSFLKSASGARNLNTLRIDNAILSRDAVHELSNLKSLQTLVLNDCALDADGAQSLVALSNLEHLSVPHSLVDDSFLAVIRRLKRIKYLDVSHTHMSPNGLFELKKCGNLERVIIGKENSPADMLLVLKDFPAAFLPILVIDSKAVALDFSVFGRAGRIKELRLLENCVNDEDLVQVSKCKSIEVLVVDSDRVTLKGIRVIIGMPKLRELSLSGERWPVELVDLLERSKSLQCIRLFGRSWIPKSFPVLRRYFESRHGAGVLDKRILPE